MHALSQTISFSLAIPTASAPRRAELVHLGLKARVRCRMRAEREQARERARHSVHASDHRERAVVDEMGEQRRRMVGRVFMVLQPTHEQSVSEQAQLRKRGRGRMRLTR